ncbi:hypothetical protein Tco_1255756 [Tanacetum coccineum]
MESANPSCSTSNREFLDPKKKKEFESWIGDSRIVDSFDGPNEIKYFDTFPTLEELEYHEWLLKYPKPSWIGISAMVIENKVKTLTITTFLFQPSKSSVPLHSGTIMSSSPHSTFVPSDSDNENTSSSMNILNYFPALPGNISPNSSDDFTKYLLDILLFPHLHDDPYIQAYDVIPPAQVIIALPAIVPPPMSDSRSFFPPNEISTPEGAKTLIESPNPMYTSSSIGSSSPVRSTTSPPNYLFNESIFAELDNSLWIISRPLGSKPVPEEFNMPPKRTSTSAAPAMTQDAIRQLVADSVAIALKAQAANLANTDNTNKNTGTSGTPIARKGINNHKRKIEDRGNTTTNNNYPKHNNNNHSNNHINKNNYPDNHNKNNHNNDYHQ